MKEPVLKPLRCIAIFVKQKKTTPYRLHYPAFFLVVLDYFNQGISCFNVIGPNFCKV